MADFNARPEAARGPAADMWWRTIGRIHTHFGRLVFIASLREPLTGRYVHLPLLETVGNDLTDRTLRHSHHQVFSEWLALGLAEQKADLDDYLISSQVGLEALPYRDLAPVTAHHVERQLYLTDLEMILELLRYEHRGAFSLPEA